MRTSRPPALATWLLTQFDSAQNSDALRGDLIEEYRRGRSAGWYWRQALLAISLDFLKVVRAHKLLVFRAIASGWFVSYVWSHFVGRPLGHLCVTLLFHLGFKPVGWNNFYGSIYGYTFLTVAGMGAALSGWVVGHFHRPYQAVMISAYVACGIFWNFAGYGYGWNAAEILRLVSDSFGNYPRFSSYLWFACEGMALTTLGALLGGLWSGDLWSRPGKVN